MFSSWLSGHRFRVLSVFSEYKTTSSVPTEDFVVSECLWAMIDTNKNIVNIVIYQYVIYRALGPFKGLV